MLCGGGGGGGVAAYTLELAILKIDDIAAATATADAVF